MHLFIAYFCTCFCCYFDETKKKNLIFLDLFEKIGSKNNGWKHDLLTINSPISRDTSNMDAKQDRQEAARDLEIPDYEYDIADPMTSLSGSLKRHDNHKHNDGGGGGGSDSDVENFHNTVDPNLISTSRFTGSLSEQRSMFFFSFYNRNF